MEPCVDLAFKVRDLLDQQKKRLVLAESCTAGRVSATLAEIPGISQWLCGSFVVYRNASKAIWLNVPQSLLDDSSVGPVSAQVTSLLAEAALERTPEAHISLAVTGEVGPGAPHDTDGIIFVAIRRRADERGSNGLRSQRRIALASPAPLDAMDVQARVKRLNEATRCVLSFAIEHLQ